MSYLHSLGYYTFAVLSRLGVQNIYGYNISEYVYMDPGVEVVDGVYIGSLATATNPHWLRENNIGYIINLSGMRYPSELPVHDIDMPDAAVTTENMDGYTAKFNNGVSILTRARGNGKRVLVHCAAGINRSATLIAFYLIEGGCTYDQVVQILTTANKKRGLDVLTNPSFRFLLRARDSFNRNFDN